MPHPPMQPPWKRFQDTARERMSVEMGAALAERRLQGHPKLFDHVSEDGTIVGDAKYLTFVNGTQWPPAKSMEIAGHVWLLEHTTAIRRFLVFGNERRVPEGWLKRYGHMVHSVEFYYMADDGTLHSLNTATPSR